MDPAEFVQELGALQPPPGAHGAYGTLGDDNLLGQAPGYGLRQLGTLVRRHVIFTADQFEVVQPPGFETAGVQSGNFTSPDQLNDTTLGWVMYDLRPQFEADMKFYTLPLESQWQYFAIQSGLTSPLTAHEQDCYKDLESCYTNLTSDETPSRYYATRVYFHIAEQVVNGRVSPVNMPGRNAKTYDPKFTTPGEQAIIGNALDMSIKDLLNSIGGK